MDKKDLILQEIQEANWKKFKSELIYFSDGQNLNCGKETELKIRQLHNINRSEPILLAFHRSDYEEGDFFRESRTYIYSALFLETGISVVKRTITKGWDTEDDDNIDFGITWESIETVEYSTENDLFYFIHHNENEPSYVAGYYFGMTRISNPDVILSLMNNIVARLATHYEAIDDFLDKLSDLVDKENYSAAVQIIKENPQYEDNYRFLFLKIQTLKGLGDIDEALFLIEKELKEEKEKELQEKVDGILYGLKGECLRTLNKNYDALLSYQQAFPYFKDDRETQRNIKSEMTEAYNEHINSFTQQQYADRKVILLSNSGDFFKSENLSVLNSNQLPNISFPITHPKPNETYVGHPRNSSYYIPLTNYDYELLNDRVNELCYLLQCLGATEIEIVNIKGESKDIQQNRKTNIEAEVSTKITSLKGEYGEENSMGESSSGILKIGRKQQFNPTSKPYIPNDLIWYPSEVGWQRLAKQRLEGNLLTHNETISSEVSQVLSNSELKSIKADLKVFFTNIKVNYNTQKDSEIKNHETTEWSVRAIFRPMEEFEPKNIVSSQPYTSYIEIDSFSENEQKFIEQLEKAYEDDVITEMEQRILNRLQTRFNISDKRYEELINHIIQNKNPLTEDEKEYLEEYRLAKENGEISEDERTFLRSFASQLGISPERVEELEKINTI